MILLLSGALTKLDIEHKGFDQILRIRMEYAALDFRHYGA